MSEADKDYEVKVLTMVINTYLEEIVSVTKEGLKFLESNRDQVVWKLAIRIYTQSGYKVEFSTIREIIEAKTGAIKHYLEMETRQFAEEKKRQKLRNADFSVRVLTIVGEQLGVELNKVKLDSHLVDDLGMDDLDLVELIGALEEEFGIEIPDNTVGEQLGVEYSFNWRGLSSSVSETSITAGAECTVKNLINLVSKRF
jgi:acyl carrier protein